MKIAHVITRMIVGGAQENTLFTVRGHLDHGHDAVLITGPTTGPEGKLLEHSAPPDLKVLTVPHLQRELSVGADYRAYCELVELFQRERFEIVHTHSSKAGIIGRLAAWRAKVPVIVHTVHGQAFHEFERPLKNQVYIFSERIAARVSDRIYAVAQAMVDQCVAARIAPPERYSVVYSGMDLEPFLEAKPDPALAAKLGLPPGAPVVGKIARLFELKGYDYLLAAAPAICAAVPNVRFLIVGDGLLRASLEAQVRELKLAEHFIFTGLVPPDEIYRYTALMDVLVHLSLREGLPRTVVQALASAKPAVGFALDGTPEVIKDLDTGIICPPRDPAAVAQGVIKLLQDRELATRLGTQGREFVRTRWDWHRMVDVLEADYMLLLEGKGIKVP